MYLGFFIMWKPELEEYISSLSMLAQLVYVRFGGAELSQTFAIYRLQELFRFSSVGNQISKKKRIKKPSSM